MKHPAHPLAVGELADGADILEPFLAANRVFVAIASRALTGLRPEITLPQWRALVLIDLNGALTVGELATALGVVPSTATRMCDRLVAKRLVSRTVDPSNRRRVSISLLPAGKRLVRTSTDRRRAEISGLLATLDPDQQADVGTSLRILVDAANRYTGDRLA